MADVLPTGTERRLREVEAERDRAVKTIVEIEEVLTLYGVAITSPLADAILEILAERAGET